jgi:hypothetical protein
LFEIQNDKHTMQYDAYQLEASNSLLIFEFVSEGPKGSIRKRVQYQKINRKHIYNLAFGDIDPTTDEFDDTVITDNNDSEKVLATVAATVYLFIEKHPKAIIYIKGSTLARTRLYRIGISANLEEINKSFDIYGLLDNIGWTQFDKNKNYSAFLIRKTL